MNKSIYIVLYAIATLFLNINILFAQQYTVNGKVVNQNREPIEFVNANLLNNDQELVEQIITDNLGSFSFIVEKGNYRLSLEYFGSEYPNQNLEVNQNLDLGELIIEESTILESLVIEGKKRLIEKKIDRLVFNVENLPTSDGGNAMDIFNITPGLIVSNDNISMAGKGGVNVMINDRFVNLTGQELVSFLKGIQSSDIKNVEIITTPPAKYDASGNSGIINIKLKRTENNTWSSNLYTNYQQGKYAQGSIGGSYNFRKNDLTFFLNASYNKGKYFGEENSKIIYPELDWNGKTKYVYDTKLLSTRVGIDYNVTDNWQIGGQYMVSFNNPKFIDHNKTEVSHKSDINKEASIFTNGMSNVNTKLNALNLHSIVKLDTIGRKLSLDIDFLKYDSDVDRNYCSQTISNILNIQNEQGTFNNLTYRKVQNYSTQLDFEHPLKSFNLNYGIKLSFTETNNDVNMFNTTSGFLIIDSEQSNEFNYKENMQAIYLSGNTKFWKDKWEAQLGVRAENTETTGNSIALNSVYKNSYFELFPTAYLTYKPNESNYFGIEYGRRIYRPGFGELNPFRFYSSPYSYSEGNPELKPTYTTNIELSYVYNGFFQATLFYSQDKNNSGQVIIPNNEDFTQATVRLNYFDNYNVGTRLIYIYNKLNWWGSQNSANLFINHSESKIFPITPESTNGFGGVFKSTNIFYLNHDKTITTGFDFLYRVANKSNDLVYNYDNLQFNAFFKMLFLERNLQFTVVGNNIFKEYQFNTKSSRNGNLSFVNGYYDSQYFRVSVSYSFGNNKIRANQRNVSNEQEKNRIY